jgi:hypothetical protein
MSSIDYLGISLCIAAVIILMLSVVRSIGCFKWTIFLKDVAASVILVIKGYCAFAFLALILLLVGVFPEFLKTVELPASYIHLFGTSKVWVILGFVGAIMGFYFMLMNTDFTRGQISYNDAEKEVAKNHWKWIRAKLNIKVKESN